MQRRLGDPRATLALFLLTLAVLLVMREFFPEQLAIPLEGSDIRPVLLLEFASGPDHLVHIFGLQGDPQRAARIAGMNAGNMIDYLFMPAYGLLTLSFFAGITRRLGDHRWLWLGWLGIVAACSDAIENAILISLVGDMADPARELALLPYPVWLKFALLALSCGGVAIAFLRLRLHLLALLCLPAPLLLVPGFLSPLIVGPLATAMVGLGWVAMGFDAARRVVAERRAHST